MSASARNVLCLIAIGQSKASFGVPSQGIIHSVDVVHFAVDFGRRRLDPLQGVHVCIENAADLNDWIIWILQFVHFVQMLDDFFQIF